jgi:hypothetical protein
MPTYRKKAEGVAKQYHQSPMTSLYSHAGCFCLLLHYPVARSRR